MWLYTRPRGPCAEVVSNMQMIVLRVVIAPVPATYATNAVRAVANQAQNLLRSVARTSFCRSEIVHSPAGGQASAMRVVGLTPHIYAAPALAHASHLAMGHVVADNQLVTNSATNRNLS
jgi:hypothetical protein